jgi:ribonuclease PH
MTVTTRRSGRADDQLRVVTIETGVAPYAEGSALIAFGDTRIWCTASVDDRVPSWLEGRGGWVTAEYSMLPRATNTRTSRDRATNSGRSQEISRLIGRSLRAGVNLRGLGERHTHGGYHRRVRRPLARLRDAGAHEAAEGQPGQIECGCRQRRGHR